MVAYGIRYLVENYIAKPWTMEDVDMAEAFYKWVPQALLVPSPSSHQHSTHRRAAHAQCAAWLPDRAACCCLLWPLCRTHLSPGHTAFPFPRALFEKFIRENNGEELTTQRSYDLAYPLAPRSAACIVLTSAVWSVRGSHALGGAERGRWLRHVSQERLRCCRGCGPAPQRTGTAAGHLLTVSPGAGHGAFLAP